MLTNAVRSLAVAVSLALGTLLPAVAAGPMGPRVPTVVPYVAPTPEEVIDLAYMREEEKFSRDLYLAFAETWQAAPFAFVANAEQKHMDAALRLIRAYALPDPVAGMLVGEFGDAELQALHATLLQQGLESELGALRAGGLVEEIDLLDLEFSLARTTKPDIARVYANLACGSRNHLRAFAASVEALDGQAYVAQSMSQAAVDAILQQPFERCGRP